MPVILNEKMGDIPKFIKKNPSVNKESVEQDNKQKNADNTSSSSMEEITTTGNNMWKSHIRIDIKRSQV